MYKESIVKDRFLPELILMDDVIVIDTHVADSFIESACFVHIREFRDAGDFGNVSEFMDRAARLFKQKDIHSYFESFDRQGIAAIIVEVLQLRSDAVLITSALQLSITLTRSISRYSISLSSYGLHRVLALLVDECPSRDIVCLAIDCEAGLVMHSQVPEFLMAWTIVPGMCTSREVRTRIVHLVYCAGLTGGNDRRVAETALAIVPLVSFENDLDVRMFIEFIASMSDHFSFVIGNPRVREMLNYGLFQTKNEDVLESVLRVFARLYELEDVASVVVPRRLASLVTHQSDAICHRACDALTSVFIRCPQTITAPADLAGILVASLDNRRFRTRVVAFNTLFVYANVFPQYVPLMLECGLIKHLVNMLDFDGRDVLLQALALLDCVFVNNTEFTQPFISLNGREAVASLADSESEVSDTASGFLLKWFSIASTE